MNDETRKKIDPQAHREDEAGALRPAGGGAGGVSFTLEVPFKLSPGRQLKDLDEPVTQTVDGLEFSLSQGPTHVRLAIRGLSSEKEAEEHLARAWCGLAWTAVTRSIGFELSERLRSPAVRDTAREFRGPGGLGEGMGKFHGAADAGVPIVYPSDKRIAKVGGSATGLITSASGQEFLSGITERYLDADPGVFTTPTRVAVDLFAGSFYEATSHARLMTRVSALEVLSEQQKRPEPALDLVRKWQEDLKAAEESSEEDQDVAALRSLQGLLRHEESHVSAIRRVVRETFAGDPGKSKAAVKTATSVYVIRSKMLHDWAAEETEVTEAAEEARKLLSALLQAKLSG